MTAPSNKVETTLTNFRLPTDLLAWVKTYARSKNTTVTRVIVDLLTDLRAKNEEGHVDQI